MRKQKQMKQTGYEFWLPNGRGGYITSLDGDKLKPRFTTKERNGGNGFGISTKNLSFTITVRDRHMVATYK